MDSVGNNIANVNTTGFKARRTTFSESFSQLVKGASRSESKAGGTNPMQIGLGVAVGSIDTIMGQGNLQNTGRMLDIGIEGNAFFGVSDGVGTYYTRCGAFQLDAQGYIILPTNGMVLQGRMADSMGNFPPGTAIGNIQIPLNQQSPAKATTEVSLARNLRADGEAKGSVSYTQRLLHAADEERFFGANGLNDKGRGLHDTVLSSLYDGNGVPFNMKEGDIITMSFYTDTTYDNKIDVSFFITADGMQVNRVNKNTGLPDTNLGTADFTGGKMNINSLNDLMRGIEYTLSSYLDNVNPIQNPSALPGDDDYVEPLSVTLNAKGELELRGVRSDIFGFDITSSNPNTGKVDNSANVTKVFSFGSYLGPGVLGSQTYVANGFNGKVNIPTGAFFPSNSTYNGIMDVTPGLTPVPGSVPLDTTSADALQLDIWAPKTVTHRNGFNISPMNNPTPFTVALPNIKGLVQNNSGESIQVLIPYGPSTLPTPPGNIPVGDTYTFKVGSVINNGNTPIVVLLADGTTERSIPKGTAFPAGSSISPNGTTRPGPVTIDFLIPGSVPDGGDTATTTIQFADMTWTTGGVTSNVGPNGMAEDLSLCTNNNGKNVNVFVRDVVPIGGKIPEGSKNSERVTYNNAAGTVTLTPLVHPLYSSVEVKATTMSGVLLRPAEQYDYLADILNANGEGMSLVDGAVISFTSSIGEDRINSTPLTFKKNSTLLDDLMMQLRNDLKLPYDYMGKDNNNYPSVAIKTPSLGEDGIPEGALVFRGLPGKAFSINDLTITARNPGGVAMAPQGFQEGMAVSLYRSAENAEVVPTEIEIYDDSGAAHQLRFEFTHTGVNGEWIWKASFSGKEIINPPGSGSGKITFGRDGTLAAWLYDDGGSALQFDPANGAKAMRVKLSAGGPGNWKGLTSQAEIASTAQAQTQNGYTSGSLTEMSIDEFGLIEGKFSNGINKKIAQILVVDFANPGGLLDVSDNVYTLSANSGEPVWGRPKNQSSSSLRPGALEMANVDLANEFTNMITTQRGYQANSRIITVSDTMLEEAVNLKR
jgi:flagellar hook-basal body protein